MCVYVAIVIYSFEKNLRGKNEKKLAKSAAVSISILIQR